MSAQIGPHAFDRVSRRLNMSHKEVADILDQEHYVLVGREEGTTRVHKLFFSVFDKNWFVAVQDEVDSYVITVLPIAYHNRMKASPEALRRARELIEGERKPESVPVNGRISFHFSAQLQNDRGSIRWVRLGRIPQEDGVTEATVLEDQKNVVFVRDKLRKKSELSERLVSVIVFLGNKGTKTCVDLRQLFK